MSPSNAMCFFMFQAELEENKIAFPKANMHKLECLYTLFIKNTTTPEENISELHGAERAQ
jgi:hypothetical protein